MIEYLKYSIFNFVFYASYGSGQNMLLRWDAYFIL
jgi:hypothetical protein